MIEVLATPSSNRVRQCQQVAEHTDGPKLKYIDPLLVHTKIYIG